jgi:hypothetical protein
MLALSHYILFSLRNSTRLLAYLNLRGIFLKKYCCLKKKHIKNDSKAKKSFMVVKGIKYSL